MESQPEPQSERVTGVPLALPGKWGHRLFAGCWREGLCATLRSHWKQLESLERPTTVPSLLFPAPPPDSA